MRTPLSTTGHTTPLALGTRRGSEQKKKSRFAFFFLNSDISSTSFFGKDSKLPIIKAFGSGHLSTAVSCSRHHNNTIFIVEIWCDDSTYHCDVEYIKWAIEKVGQSAKLQYNQINYLYKLYEVYLIMLEFRRVFNVTWYLIILEFRQVIRPFL